MKSASHSLGALIEKSEFKAFFGNQNAQIENLREFFPNLKFKRIKQTHGDRVIHTSPHSIDFSSEADAHYTNEPNLALCISTADCIPVLIFSSNPRWVAAIHAGWRGVEQRIVPKVIAQMMKLGCSAQDLKVFIGPHIQSESFEVGNDVRDRLLASVRSRGDHLTKSPSETKSLVDLNGLLQIQLSESQISAQNIFCDLVDTMTSSSHHSYRRDRESSGRQLSFIALIEP